MNLGIDCIHKVLKASGQMSSYGKQQKTWKEVVEFGGMIYATQRTLEKLHQLFLSFLFLPKINIRIDA